MTRNTKVLSLSLSLVVAILAFGIVKAETPKTQVDEDAKNTQLIHDLLAKTIEAYKTKDKEKVIKFVRENTAMVSRKGGESFEDLFKVTEKSYSKNCYSTYRNNISKKTR